MRSIETIVLILIVAVCAYAYGQARSIDPQPPVITTGPTNAPVIVATQPAPVYDIQVIDPTPYPTEANRAGLEAPTSQPGDTGEHNPGRTDHRSP